MNGFLLHSRNQKCASIPAVSNASPRRRRMRLTQMLLLTSLTRTLGRYLLPHPPASRREGASNDRGRGGPRLPSRQFYRMDSQESSRATPYSASRDSRSTASRRVRCSVGGSYCEGFATLRCGKCQIHSCARCTERCQCNVRKLPALCTVATITGVGWDCTAEWVHSDDVVLGCQ